VRSDWTANGSRPAPSRLDRRIGETRTKADEDESGRRGRHATQLDAGFGRVVGGTILGTLIPGAGLIMAGQSVAGWTVLISFLVLLAILGGTLVGSGDVVQTLATRVVDPQFLFTAAVAAAAAAAMMLVLVLWTHSALRRNAALTSGQRAFASLLVVSLIVLIGAPLGKAASYALIQRSVLTSVFDNSNATKATTSAIPQTEQKDPWASVPRVNVLLIGSDAGADRDGLRPDSMVLASIDTRSGNTIMYSIPRNLVRAPFPAGSAGAQAWPYGFGPVGSSSQASCGENLSFCWINAVWQTAISPEAKQYFAGEQSPGLTATKQVVEGVTGLHVDYYAMLDLKGFKDFVNAIGGVVVNVHERLPIGGNSTYHVATGGWIEPGMNQRLDGYHALWFARSRWSTSDYDRMRRQRCVIAAASSQADLIKLAKGFPALASSIKSNFQTDIPLNELSAWVTLGMKVKGARVSSFPITPEVYGKYTSPDYNKIHQLVRANLDASVKPKVKASTAPSPSVSSAPTSTSTKKKSTSKSPTTSSPSNPLQAQDVKDVC
jgi:LCP family protein required for cell wall assembly